jgi:acyl carrier protein
MKKNNMTYNLKRLQQIVGEQLNLEPNKVTPNADFIKELGADSLDVIELVMTIEYEFDLDIEDRYASKIKNLQDILNYMEGNFLN